MVDSSDESTTTTPPASDRATLGYERTRIASERTLMAWVRTAVSLIGFGFSIPKFFSYLGETEPIRPPRGPITPSTIGTLLIGLGLLGLAGGVLEHVRLVGRIAPPTRKRDRFSTAFLTAVAVGAVGLIAFISLLIT